jgi:hypothetical protein
MKIVHLGFPFLVLAYRHAVGLGVEIKEVENTYQMDNTN